MIGTVDRAGGRYFMMRLPVISADDFSLFRAKLAGSYNWLHSFQYASKLLTTGMEHAFRANQTSRSFRFQGFPRCPTSLLPSTGPC